MKDRGEPSQELGRAQHFPLQAEPKDPSSSGWGRGKVQGQLSESSWGWAHPAQHPAISEPRSRLQSG